MRKTRLLTLLLLLMTAVTGAWAQTWDSGACTVTLSDGVMTVSGAGPMEDYYDYNFIPWYGYDIKTIVIESGVSSIGTYAFSYCSNLESVSIPASVTSIGTLAFQVCGSDATALTVSFAEGSTLESIGEGAFSEANLKSIDIPNSVTSIGRSAFQYCRNLESVSIPASVTSIDTYAFQNCGSYDTGLTVSIAEGSTPLTIGECAFSEANLKSIDIPNRVTDIGVAAFSSCYMLAKVNIFASSLTTYGAYAFEDNADGRKIYVLPTAVDTYKAGWPAYAADIEAMTVYTTSVKEGTEDAENWSATPIQATKGQTVTINYAGTKSVKSVTAKRKATTGNIMVYFTDAENYGDVHVYYWNDGPDWPGTAMTEVGTNDYNQKIYRAEIPATAVGIIFNGNGRQTVDITTNIADGSWWYTTDQLDGGKNKVGYVVDKYTENIDVTNVDANNWTFTQPDGNVELDIEYYPAHPVTISDGDVDATNWSATPTEQSVGQNVTLQYTGRKKIKRITIVAAPTVRTLAEATAEDVGKVVCAAGHLHDAKTAVPDGCTAVGILGKVTETGHGLILALQDATKQTWNTINGWTSVDTYAGTTLKVLPDDDARGSLTSYTTLGSTAVSNWAVAQKSDYEAIFQNLGSTTADTDGTTYDSNVDAYITTGVGGTAISDMSWSATEYDSGRAWDFESKWWAYLDKDYSRSVRPVLAF